jgi:hypothetical protein
MPKKKGLDGGLNGRRGKPLIHGEVKQKMNLALTATAKSILTEAAARCSLSASELNEKYIRSHHLLSFLEENNYFGNGSK